LLLWRHRPACISIIKAGLFKCGTRDQKSNATFNANSQLSGELPNSVGFKHEPAGGKMEERTVLIETKPKRLFVVL
jgi:hypothetical protein